MFQGNDPTTSNSIDGGDTIPRRPSSRTKDNNVYENDPRRSYLIEHAKSFRSMKDIDFNQTNLSDTSYDTDAKYRADKETDLNKKKNQRPQRNLLPNIGERIDLSYGQQQDEFLDEYTNEKEKIEKQRQRLKLLLCGMALLIALIVTAVTFVAHNKHEPKSLTPEDKSTTTPHPSPSADNNRTFDSIATFLSTFTNVDDQNFQDATKPQYQAISWMADYDTFAYSIPESSMVDGYFDFVQRYALAVLFYATNGDQWDDSSYFLQSTHACTWNYEIMMYNDEAMKVGVTCNGKKEVTALIMPKNKMNGALPPELSILTALHLIDFCHNTIQGSIPSQFTKLSRMQLFDLRHNELTGSIPDWIGTSFQNLRELGLSFNQMTGTLPSSMSQMETLKTLALMHNDFEASLAPVKNLPELEYLYLENNRFKDTVNDEFLINATSLVQLDLSSNLLTGQGLPHHFFAYPNLKVLDLSHNQIRGTIQDVHILKHPLEFLSLSNNSLTGTLPTSIAYLRSLRHLDLTGNNLSGEMPSTLGKIQSLNQLFLSENSWTPGPIPEFLSEMSNLQELGLRATNRTGSLSSQWFEKLQLLELFDISNNEMTGSIPSRLFDNSHLHYVLLNRNEFDGELPTENIGSNLQLLLLDKNRITGNLNGLCANSNISLAADCVEDEIVCECCHCCADSDVMCNNYVWYMNEEFSLESNCKRTGYAFSPAILMPKTKGRHSQGIQVNHV